VFSKRETNQACSKNSPAQAGEFELRVTNLAYVDAGGFENRYASYLSNQKS
jgi:hypothetical protein